MDIIEYVKDDLITKQLYDYYTNDFENKNHVKNVMEISLLMGNVIGMGRKDLQILGLGALFHDIGKIAIRSKILYKKEKLTDEEWKIIQGHTTMGYKITNQYPMLRECAEIVLMHHERWDGKGYPLGLSGEETPLMARIVTLSDSFDAMRTHRVYKKGKDIKEAFTEINNCKGTQFDPILVELLTKNLKSLSTL